MKNAVCRREASPRYLAWLAATSLFYACTLPAYETSTHQLLSIRAAAASDALGSRGAGLYAELGLEPNEKYPDVEGSLRTIDGLIAFGSEYEDSGSRFVLHFYDAQHGGRGLFVTLQANTSSLQWAAFDVGVVSGVFSLTQDFSILDAKDYYLHALTRRTSSVRDTNFGLLFQSLGQVAHHLQDMAQPDHVRNDQHLTGFDTSLHHTWTEGQGEAIPSFGYPKLKPDQFATVADLWANAGRGIAEFTSYNFISDDTNYRGWPPYLKPDQEFASPLPDNSRIEKISVEDLIGSWPEVFADVQVWFIGNQVTDRLNPDLSGFNQRGSTFSIFSGDLTGFNLHGQTSINRFNAAAMNDWLLPRAVAYSAALYDYFFRGRVQIDSSVAEGNVVTMTVRNASAQPYAFKAQLPGQGDGAEWSLYYDTTDGTRSRLPLTGDDIGGTTIAAGGTYELSFPMPQNVDAAKDKPFMLVYNGVIGQEAGVAGKAFNPAANRGFLVRPDFMPDDGWSGKRQLTRMAGTWLSKHSQSSAGNVDWKGHLPADTLTWDGPPSRYFYDANRRGYSRAIYKAGNLLARAPANVQGAAISRTAEPRLIVVTYEAGQLRVYARPLRERYSNDAPYDAAMNPEGWQQLYAASERPPFTPTFFNSSGTEAQLVTASGYSVAERVKLTLTGNLVTRSSVDGVAHGVVRVERHDRFPEGEHVLNKGRRDPPNPGPQACHWYPDCTSRIDCGGSQPYCNVLELDTLDTGVRIYETNQRVILDGKTAICVDYDGDVEVLCEVAYLNDSLARVYQSDRGRMNHRSRRETQCNGSLVGDSDEISQRIEVHEEQWFSPDAGMRTLRLGSIEIPLMGDEREDGHDETVDYFRAGDVDLAPIGNVHEYHATRHVGARILYIDARSQTVVYETEESRTRQDLSSTQPATDGTWQAVRATLNNSTLRETVAYVRGQRYSLAHEDTPAADTQTPGYVRPHGPMIVLQCSDTPSEVVESSQGVLPEPADWSAVIHPRANDPSQGYAMDRDGNYVISQPLWRQSAGSFVRAGTWNSISDGDIDALIPGAGAGGAFGEVRLLE